MHGADSAADPADVDPDVSRVALSRHNPAMHPPPARLVPGHRRPRYSLGTGHPWVEWRQEPLGDLIETLGLAGEGDWCDPPACDDAELRGTHDPAYVEFVAAATAGERPGDDLLGQAHLFGLGVGDNPLVQGQHTAAAMVAGATAGCVDWVLDGGPAEPGRRAFNPTGGLHHAQHARASGFCIYNDLAVGIHRALDRGLTRIAYIDVDVHHGDGVEALFADDPRVLTISAHQSPESLWPGTGRVQDRGRGAGMGSAVNLPFAPGTTDTSWLRCLDRVLDAALADFQPELIVSQHGCDPHHLDPLADLSIGTAAMEQAAHLIAQYAEKWSGGRWVATGGGGYQPLLVLPRAWTLVWGVVAGRVVPADVPEAWRSRWESRAKGTLPIPFRDVGRDDPRGAAAAIANDRTTDALIALL